MRLWSLIVALIVAVASSSLTDAAKPLIKRANIDDWPQWRGPNRDGKIADSSWPEQLSQSQLTEVWRVELGPSYSGPIVTSDRVFITETIDKRSESVRALDRATGQQLWQASWEGAIRVPFFAKSNGDWIRATPAFDGDRLYVAGIRDVLVCLDAANGEEIWRVDFVEQMGSEVPSFGFVSSPLVIGDFVYVQAGGGFVKLDKFTGKIVWRVLDDGGGMYGSAFSSPYLAEINGRPQILVQTRKELASVDPNSGNVGWKQDVPAFRGMNILTPTVVNDSIFTSSYGGRSFLFTPSGNEEEPLAETWTNKAQGYMSSPIAIGGFLYLHLRNQRFTCIDLATGESTWTTKPFGKYWSMVASGDKILALDERGELLLIRANPAEFELLDRREIADDSWAHLAVAGSGIFVRELNAMAVYRWQP